MQKKKEDVNKYFFFYYNIEPLLNEKWQGTNVCPLASGLRVTHFDHIVQHIIIINHHF